MFYKLQLNMEVRFFIHSVLVRSVYLVNKSETMTFNDIQYSDFPDMALSN